MNEVNQNLFGSCVFSDKVMRERLPRLIYERLRETALNGTPLDAGSAEIIADAMKDWAIEQGATHYTHWFSPMNGQTAEKHEAFVSPRQDGSVLFEFSGRALARGETDASAFPSGGLRATFEARGYTAWDCASPAFIRRDPDGIVALCIPTVFSGFNGEALDTRIPLLRSMTALNKAVLRLLNALHDPTVKRIVPNVGIEQEYFLIDRQLYKKRRDLIYTGRTLFGAKPPKGQEMDDQYYGAIRQRVSGFMAELNNELWRLGVPAKTQHNEAAPAQHEVAVAYDNAVTACDHNQLTMMLLRKVAARRGLACLLHEKPFAGFSGSGKHINWSIGTDSGLNLLDPGADPFRNEVFLVLFMAVIAAFHEHADLLRLSCAGLSNDYRLGGHEAPTPIISVFIGEEMRAMLLKAAGRQKEAEAVSKGGIACLSGDCSDRNRTSAVAFTGNKFEFRMPGSSQSGSWVAAVMNTIVADQADKIAARLEKAQDSKAEIPSLLSDLYDAHGAVLFSGDSYAASWLAESQKRGLPYLRAATDAIPVFDRQKTTDLFSRMNVLSVLELKSRATVHWDTYIKCLRIEAQTLTDIQIRQILPAALGYLTLLARNIAELERVGADTKAVRERLDRAGELYNDLSAAVGQLSQRTAELSDSPAEETGRAWNLAIPPLMLRVREASDALETLMPAETWPVPTYGEMLFFI